MRIGLVCPYSFEAHGGVQNHVLGLAESLTASGHQVQVLAPGDQRDGLPAYLTTTGRAVPMPYNGSVARVSFGPLVAARVRRWLEAGRFEVVHIHEPATPSVSVLALWAARVPVVATFHTAQLRGRALESAGTVLRPGLRKIAAHIAVSHTAAWTMRRYVDVDPLVIPNGLHVAGFHQPLRPASGALTAVFVGRIDEPRKGLAVLLRALPQLFVDHPELRVLVVGGGVPPHVEPALRRRVSFAGPVDDAEKARLLAGADLLVAPHTHGESFGIVVTEAMAAGTPVVASDLPAFRELLDDGRLGRLFAVGDPAVLARAVSELLRDPVRRAELAARAQAAAAAYDWSQVGARIQQVYAEVTRSSEVAVG